jgi:hypothetical protein
VQLVLGHGWDVLTMMLRMDADGAKSDEVEVRVVCD